MLTSTQTRVNHSHVYRRLYERKHYRVEVAVAYKDRLFQGCLMDISLGGAYIQTRNADRYWEGERVTITIPFTNGEKHVRRSGHIAWKDRLGIAIAFSD